MPASDAGARSAEVILFVVLFPGVGRFRWAHVKRGEARPLAIFYHPAGVGGAGFWLFRVLAFLGKNRR
jgi:hypothetical protein